MWKRVISAREGNKVLSVEYNLLSKEWKLTSKKGKEVLVVPSERVFIRIEEYAEGEKKSKGAELKAYAKERFPQDRYDLKLFNGLAYLALCRDCEGEVELEPFALARLGALYGEELLVIDWGKRKTVFVELKGGFLRSFRVVLRGGDYITKRLSESRSLGYEEAEGLKRSEGLRLEEVREAVKEILELSGYIFEDKRVLLTGGTSRLKELRGLFSETVELRHCEPEYAVCLGACLRKVLKNPYPDFVQKELSPQDIKMLAYTGGAMALAFFVSLFAMQRLYSVEPLRDAQRTEFKRLFPNEPIISLYDQVRTKVSTGEEYKLTKLLSKAQENLRPGMKLYRLEYTEGRLTIEGEADRKTLEGLRLFSTKETPTGRVEFEIKVP